MAASTSNSVRIQLTEQERELQRVLVECAQWIDSNERWHKQLEQEERYRSDKGKERENVELRIAGGWVRDKLLGSSSDDIDISTCPSPLTGDAFGHYLHDFLAETGRSELLGKLAVVAANPEQSKHLATTKTNLLGYTIDFVQLRGGEVYEGDSRIPQQVKFGTPQEDAERRDLTINSLFYNLHTSEVEDFTGRGLSDLLSNDRVIRTPLAPFETFRDDPLRVVRCVRFASRFGHLGFRLDDALRRAVAEPLIRESLQDPKKISRERVGVELEKMLASRNALLSMELIHDLDLHPLVFLYDHATLTPESAAPQSVDLSLQASRTLSRLLASPDETLARLGMTARASTDDKKRLFLCAALLPLNDVLVQEKKRELWVGETIVREGIKWPNAERIFATRARTAAPVLRGAVRDFASVTSLTGEQRAALGITLRSVHAPSEHVEWPIALLWALVTDICAHDDSVASAYYDFVQLVRSTGLDKDFDAKPLLDGKTANGLMAEVVAPEPFKPGPASQRMIEHIVRYQLANPRASAEECRAHFVQGDGRATVLSVIAEAPQPGSGKSEKKPKKRKELAA